MIGRWLERQPRWLAGLILVGGLFVACCVLPALIEAAF